MANTTNDVFADKCCEILHAILVEIRNLSYAEGQRERIHALAEMSHTLPRAIAGVDDHAREWFRDSLVTFDKTHGRAWRYLWILDMDDTEFQERFRSQSWSWPEPADANT
jgi:hypothetical protein